MTTGHGHHTACSVIEGPVAATWHPTSLTADPTDRGRSTDSQLAGSTGSRTSVDAVRGVHRPGRALDQLAPRKTHSSGTAIRRPRWDPLAKTGGPPAKGQLHVPGRRSLIGTWSITK